MKQKLNVIFIGSFLYPNGYAATKRKQQFLDYIKDKGDTVRVLLTLKRAKGHELNSVKGRYKGIPYEVVGSNVKPNSLFPITFLLMLVKAFQYLALNKKKHHKNIIVAFAINYHTLFPLLWGKILGYKIVFDIVEDFSTLQNSKTLKEKIKKFMFRAFPKIFKKFLANGISVISSYLYNDHENFIGSIPVTLVPISAENLFYLLDKSQSQTFKLLYSGTYGEKEGLPSLFDAFHKFSQFEKNTTLTLTGNCPDHIVELLKEKLGNLNKIELTGRLDDRKYYQKLKDADVLLMTRTNSGFANAGFPYKLGEYLATKNPVICTDTSDISLYLKDMESSVIIPPDDKNALYKAMCFLYENSTISKDIGEKGYKVCETLFHPVTNSKKFYQLLESC